MWGCRGGTRWGGGEGKRVLVDLVVSGCPKWGERTEKRVKGPKKGVKGPREGPKHLNQGETLQNGVKSPQNG